MELFAAVFIDQHTGNGQVSLIGPDGLQECFEAFRLADAIGNLACFGDHAPQVDFKPCWYSFAVHGIGRIGKPDHVDRVLLIRDLGIGLWLGKDDGRSAATECADTQQQHQPELFGSHRSPCSDFPVKTTTSHLPVTR